MDMITMDEAIDLVLQHTSPIDETNAGLMDALGCTLAADVRSDIDIAAVRQSDDGRVRGGR